MGIALKSLYLAGLSQHSPSQDLTVNEGYSFSREDPISLGIPVTRHFDNGKTRLAKPPYVLTNPDRSRTYLVHRAHRIGQATSKTNPRVAPRWPRRLPVSDQHSEEHWHGGFKIKMALESVEPKGKRLRWQMVKPKLGLAGGVLFKANCQGVPIITQPRKEEHSMK